jgi:hypothetical protein
MLKDRSKKATAPEPITPTGKFATLADAARQFAARRQKTIDYVTSTNDESTSCAPTPAPARWA